MRELQRDHSDPSSMSLVNSTKKKGPKSNTKTRKYVQSKVASLRKKWGGHQLAGHQQQLTLSQSLSQTQKHTERR